jgi:hypothetical protein
VRDRLTIRVPAFDRPALLPHDLAHFVVEQDLALRWGFWGCVAAGAMFPGMTVVSGRKRPDAAARSQAALQRAKRWGTEAEVLVNAMLTIARENLDGHWPAAYSALRRVWRPREPSRELPNADEVRRIAVALREAERQWQALEVGQRVTVVWSPDTGAQRKERLNESASRRPAAGALRRASGHPCGIVR